MWGCPIWHMWGCPICWGPCVKTSKYLRESLTGSLEIDLVPKLKIDGF